MAFDGNGNWIPEFSAKEDRDAGVKILASRFDDVFQQDLKESFEKCITVDSQNKPTADFNFNNFKGINLADPVLDNDAVNKKSAVLNTGEQNLDGILKVNTLEDVKDSSRNVPNTEWISKACKEGNLFGVPNYDGIISWNGEGEKTAPSNGYFHVAKLGNWAFFEAKINNFDGNGIPIYLGRDGANYWSDSTTQVVLKKGDSVDILRWETSGTGHLFAYFIPCL